MGCRHLEPTCRGIFRCVVDVIGPKVAGGVESTDLPFVRLDIINTLEQLQDPSWSLTGRQLTLLMRMEENGRGVFPSPTHAWIARSLLK